jgi:hypothetical protein
VRLQLIIKLIKEIEMNEIKILNKRYAAIAWGSAFLLLGVLMLIPGDQNAVFVLGAGIILLSLNLARRMRQIPVSTFSITLGVLATGLGMYALLRPLLHAPRFEVDAIPLVLIVIGLYVLIPGPRYADGKL